MRWAGLMWAKSDVCKDKWWNEDMKEQMQIPLSISHTTHHLPSYVQTPHPKITTSPSSTHSPRPTPLRLQEATTLLIPRPLQDSNHGLRALTRRLGPMLRFVLSHSLANVTPNQRGKPWNGPNVP